MGFPEPGLSVPTRPLDPCSLGRLAHSTGHPRFDTPSRWGWRGARHSGGMKITTSGDFAATPERLFAVLADQSFQDGAASEPGASSRVETRGDRTVVTTVRVLPTDRLPDFARTFVGDTLRLTEVQDWGPPAADGSRTGTLKLTIDGAPVTLDGDVTLVPTATGSQQSVRADLRARIPLVGGKVEQAAAPAVKDAIEHEYGRLRAAL